MKLTDTHSHLYDEAFDRDREEALARAAAEGVGQLLLPGIGIGLTIVVLGWRRMMACTPRR